MNRKSLTWLCSFVVLMLMAATPAMAQGRGGGAGGGRQGGPATPPAPIVPLPKVAIEVVGGVTFDHAAGGVFGGGVSYTATKHVQILVEAGRLTNVLPKATAANLNTVAAGFVASGTTPFGYTAKRPGAYGLGDIRFTTPMSRSGLQLFLDGGAGVAHVTSKISAHSGTIDETGAFLAAIAPLPNETKAMFAAGTGLSIRVRKRSVVDLGYRYGRIFTTAPKITTNRIYMALRIGI